MISRTAYTQLQYSPLLLAGTVVGLASHTSSPPVLTLAVRVARPADGRARLAPDDRRATCPRVRYFEPAVVLGAALPAIAVFYLGATLYSAFAHWRGRGGMWKGRERELVRAPLPCRRIVLPSGSTPLEA